jgi:hypothetical protein
MMHNSGAPAQSKNRSFAEIDVSTVEKPPKTVSHAREAV